MNVSLVIEINTNEFILRLCYSLYNPKVFAWLKQEKAKGKKDALDIVALNYHFKNEYSGEKRKQKNEISLRRLLRI